MSPRVLLYLALVSCAPCQSVSFQWVQQIGGSAGQSLTGIANDAAGNIYVAGNTASLNFPVKNAVQANPGGAGLYRVDGSQIRPLANSGLVNAGTVAVDPSNPQTIYATDGKTLLKSADAGGSWTALTSPSTFLQSVAIDPSAGNVLYAATYGDGIFKSTDGGMTWSAIDNGIPINPQDGKRYASGIWVDPHLPTVLFTTGYTGLARSSDGGASWQTTLLPNSLSNLSTVSFDPLTPGTVYIGDFNGVEKSTDDGATWKLLPAPTDRQFQTTTVLADPGHAGTLYAGGYSGLWKSTDGGNTWTSFYFFDVFYMAIDPTGVLYYATYNAVYRSADQLTTVTQVGPALEGVDGLAVAGSHVFIGTRGGSNVFVTKLDAQGNVLFATYFGGSALDVAYGMALDSSGAVYVTGTTDSSDFPTTKGAYATQGGSFLFKLNADGSLAYSTYFAPAGSAPASLAVDAAGSAYLAGVTTGNLPVTPGAYQTSLQGSYPCCSIIGPGLPPVTNGFVTKFNASGNALVYSTYFGAFFADVTAMALNGNGDAIVGGGANLYRFSADGSALLGQSTQPANIYALMTDPAGNLYAGGTTVSNLKVFQPTAGAFETAPPIRPMVPYGFGFITKFDAQFNVLAATLLAGEGGDIVQAFAMAANGNILAGGYTDSRAFPLRGSAQGAFAQSTGFVTELTADLSSVLFSTLAGDTRTFGVRSVAPAPDGGVIFAGTATTNLGEVGAVSPDNQPGALETYVVKAGIQPAMPRIDAVINVASLLGVALSPGETFTVQGAGFGADAVLLLNGSALPLIAQSGTSLTAELPLDFTAAGAVTVTVQSGGATSNPFLAAFLPAAPGIFSADGSGTGQAYVLNADGTRNSPSNPAKEGSEITIYATGVGHMSFTNGYAVTDAPPVVAIAQFGAPGIAATYGPVDGLPGNVYQISVYVPHPSAFASGNPNLANYVMPPASPVFLQFNGASSQYALTISIGGQ